jgi:hypothetical protein
MDRTAMAGLGAIDEIDHVAEPAAGAVADAASRNDEAKT